MAESTSSNALQARKLVELHAERTARTAPLQRALEMVAVSAEVVRAEQNAPMLRALTDCCALVLRICRLGVLAETGLCSAVGIYIAMGQSRVLSRQRTHRHVPPGVLPAKASRVRARPHLVQCIRA